MKTFTKKYPLIFAIILLLITSIFIKDYVTLESIKNNKTWMLAFVNNNYSLSVFLFFTLCAIFVNSPVPFAAIIKILGGFFFGPYMGAIYNIVATVLACILGFWISRYAFKDAFEKKYYNRMKVIENKIEENGFYYFLTLRLVMIVPYFLINITAGISRVSFKDFLVSTLLGVIPASLVYANGGKKLEQINAVSELFTTDVAIAILLIGSITLIPAYYFKEHKL